jgi:hypothetical protein
MGSRGFLGKSELRVVAFGIQVCVVEPGGYDTEIYQSNAQHWRAPAGGVYAPLQTALDKSYQSVSRRDPEDFANAILDLVRNPAPPFRTRTSDDVRRFIGCGACEVTKRSYGKITPIVVERRQRTLQVTGVWFGLTS